MLFQHSYSVVFTASSWVVSYEQHMRHKLKWVQEWIALLLFLYTRHTPATWMCEVIRIFSSRTTNKCFWRLCTTVNIKIVILYIVVVSRLNHASWSVALTFTCQCSSSSDVCFHSFTNDVHHVCVEKCTREVVIHAVLTCRAAWNATSHLIEWFSVDVHSRWWCVNKTNDTVTAFIACVR